MASTLSRTQSTQNTRTLAVQTVLISLLLAGASTLLWSFRDDLRLAPKADAQAEEEEAVP